MKILFTDAYFEPEQMAFTHLERDLIEGLVSCGYEIEIVCPVPTRGVSRETAKEYKKKKHEYLYDGRVRVTRFFAVREGENPFFRAVRYFWCNYRTYRIGKKIDGIDAVFSTSTPPTQGYFAGKIAKKHNVPLIYSLQDVFPASLVTAGLAKKGSLLWKIGRWLEAATYNKSSVIVAISNTMKENLLTEKVDKEKVRVVSNWIDTAKIRPVPKADNRLFDEYGISRDKFTVLYAGNFGSAQGAEIVFDIAELFKNDDTVQFVIFGGGSGYKHAEEKAKTYQNVFIHPLLPQERVAEVYSMGDVALITCKKGVGKSGMPSKTWSIMACGTPALAMFDTDSELASIISKSKAGVTVEPDDVSGAAEKIKQFKENKIPSYGGRDYVIKYASREICVKQYVDVFEELTLNNKDRIRGK